MSAKRESGAKGGAHAVRAALFFTSMALSLGLPAVLIAQKEALLASGRVVLLRLAPVDPRSLMQGDYMDLRYALWNDMLRAEDQAEDDETPDRAWPERGVVIVRLDENRVAALGRLENPGEEGAMLPPEEQRLRYRMVHGTPRFGAESYFFEEGRADYYQAAKYGELRVSDKGEALLSALRDADRNAL